MTPYMGKLKLSIDGSIVKQPSGIHVDSRGSIVSGLTDVKAPLLGHAKFLQPIKSPDNSADIPAGLATRAFAAD